MTPLYPAHDLLPTCGKLIRLLETGVITAQKIKFSNKKSLMQNFIFCAVHSPVFGNNFEKNHKSSLYFYSYHLPGFANWDYPILVPYFLFKPSGNLWFSDVFRGV